MTDTAAARSPDVPVQWGVAGAGLAVLAVGALWLGAEGWKVAALFAVGGLLGITLYHAGFGFTAAYRAAMARREVAAVNAQIVMLGAAMLLFAPVLAAGQVFGHAVGGAVAPVGLQVAVGSLLFGLGMQLGGGCGSGTLYTVGGGSSRMLLTLVAFCVGGFWASLDMPWWGGLPRWGSISLAREFGWPGAIALQLAVLAAIWWGLRLYAAGTPQPALWDAGFNWRRLAVGPWPLLLGAALLALLNWATLLIAGHPWTITWGFTLWAGKVAVALGWDPSTSPFWSGRFASQALENSLWRDVTSVMNIGIVIGALTAAGLAGRFRPTLKIPPRSLAAAALGGLVMGYGARLAFGCNIGAFFSGFASTSLHAWLWIVFALAGTWLGMRLRPLFGLAN